MTGSDEAYEMTLGRRDAINGVPYQDHWSLPRKQAWFWQNAIRVIRESGAGAGGDQPSFVSAPREAA